MFVGVIIVMSMCMFLLALRKNKEMENLILFFGDLASNISTAPIVSIFCVISTLVSFRLIHVGHCFYWMTY